MRAITLEGRVCVLPFGVTTPPDGYTAMIAVSNPGAGDTFAVVAGGLRATQAYQITVTVAGPPDQFTCSPAANGGFLISGACVLPDAVVGLPYQGHLPTSHGAGGSASVVAGALPPGLTLQTTAGPRDAASQLAGTPTTAGTYMFTMKLTDYYGHQATQQFTLAIEP